MVLNQAWLYSELKWCMFPGCLDTVSGSHKRKFIGMDLANLKPGKTGWLNKFVKTLTKCDTMCEKNKFFEFSIPS